MEGYERRPPAPLISRYWSPGWNSVQALNKFQQEVGGPLRGGDPGKRLIEPQKMKAVPFYSAVPDAFKPRAGEWLIVPLHHIFGSEELSILSPGIAERAPKPYLALNPDDAKRLQVAEGDAVELPIGYEKYRVASENRRGNASGHGRFVLEPIRAAGLFLAGI